MTAISPTYRLSDAQWVQIKDFLPANGRRGGQWHDHRLLIDGILWALSDGGRCATCPRSSAPGKPSMTASASGAARACGTRSSCTCKPAR